MNDNQILEHRNKEQTTPTLVRKIDGMTYCVGIHFSETSKETMDDKVKRMLRIESQSIKQ